MVEFVVELESVVELKFVVELVFVGFPLYSVLLTRYSTY